MTDLEQQAIEISRLREGKNIDTPASHNWHKYIWFGAGSGLFFVLILLLLFVAKTVSTLVEIMSLKGADDLAFIFSSIALIDLTLLRLLAILVGAAIAFAGLAVSFFAHDKATSLSGEIHESASAYAKAALSAYSPGIVGVVIGAIIIVTAVLATIEHSYSPPTKTVTYVRPLTALPLESGDNAYLTASPNKHPGFKPKNELLKELKKKPSMTSKEIPHE